MDYGAIIQRLQFRGSDGGFTDMSVGLDSPEDYLKDEAFLGACVGRFAGRISGGALRIGDESHRISNRDGITLHGGEAGFGKRYWKIDSVKKTGQSPEINLSYLSRHGEEGFPGNLFIQVQYRLEGTTLRIRHRAETDHPTVVNLTNHSYFKIDPLDSIDHYLLRLGSARHLETDARLLPTGRILDVAGTPFDFRQSREIGSMRLDTPYILDTGGPAAELVSRLSGVRMRVETNQPAMVVYTPPHFPGICFETQGYPDAPNHSGFPSTELHPGQIYHNESRFTFDNL